jgi:hypothetical protein
VIILLSGYQCIAGACYCPSRQQLSPVPRTTLHVFGFTDLAQINHIFQTVPINRLRDESGSPTSA